MAAMTLHRKTRSLLKSGDWLAAGESLKIRLRFGFELDSKAVDWFG